MADAGEIALLGNLLALPASMNQQAAEQEKMRALFGDAKNTITGAPLYSPAQVNQYAGPPASRFPGSDTPVLGSILSGAGMVGQVLQTLSGASPAPRGDRMAGIARFLSAQHQLSLDAQRGRLGSGIREGENSRELFARTAEAGAPGVATTGATATTDAAMLRRQFEAGGLAGPELEQKVLAETQARMVARQEAGARATAGVRTDLGVQQAEARAPAMKDARSRLAAGANLRARLSPLIPRVTAALSTNPTFAATVQPAALWFGALQGDPNASAVGQLFAQRAALARTVDVGNLSGPEQQVWDVFVNAKPMTQQQFLNSMSMLDQILRKQEFIDREIATSGEVPTADEIEAVGFDRPGAPSVGAAPAGGEIPAADFLAQ